MLPAQRLDPDVGDAELDEQCRGQDARLQVAADGDDGLRELGEADLPQRLGVGRVGDDDVAELTREPLDHDRIAVDGEHLGAAADELERESRAEPAEPDDGDRFLVPSQWSS